MPEADKPNENRHTEVGHDTYLGATARFHVAFENQIKNT